MALSTIEFTQKMPLIESAFGNVSLRFGLAIVYHSLAELDCPARI